MGVVYLTARSLKGWTGDLDFWRIEDGTITGETTPGHMVKHNTFLIWEGGETKGDFELTAEFKLIGGNSGIQYRSFEVPGSKWVVAGYQADMDGDDHYTGIIYGERFRGILCPRGDKTVIENNHKPKIVGKVGDPHEIASHIKHQDWNTYHITCHGYHMEQRINDVVTAECDDEDTTMRRSTGIIALQLHAGYVMKVQYKNIKIRRSRRNSLSAPMNRPRRARRKSCSLPGIRAMALVSTNTAPAAYSWPTTSTKTCRRFMRSWSKTAFRRIRTFSTMPTASSSLPTAAPGIR